MASTWNDCRDLAIEALRERWNDYRDEFADEGDVIFEIADSAVPVYNADRMSVAAHPDVWGSEPDPGLFGDGDDLMQIVAVYIFTALEEALYAELETLRDQDEDEQNAAGDEEIVAAQSERPNFRRGSDLEPGDTFVRFGRVWRVDESYVEQAPGDRRHLCISRDNEAGAIILRPDELYEIRQ